jgi:hypothetical protein
MNLSVVMTTRNDSRQANFLQAIRQFKKLDAEIVVVEWHPLLNNQPLWNTVEGVRIITVPGDGKFEEFKAKNVGIRRAKGDFILSTNPDILLSQEMIDWLNQVPTKLRQDCFYRANRHDLDEEGNVFNIHRNTMCDRVHHTNAAGDFMLMHRSQWDYLRAYLELETTDMVDAYIIHHAIRRSALKQVILEEPIYHLPHPVSFTPSAVFRDEMNNSWNEESWGMAGVELEES